MNYRQLLIVLAVASAAATLVVRAHDGTAPADDANCKCKTRPAAPTATKTTSTQAAQSPPSPPPTGKADFKLPKMFDFEQYKKLFHKSYSSLVEEIVRRKYLLAKALRAVISAIKYKRAIRSSYLGVNHFSDRSPQELDRQRNKMLMEETFAKLNGTRVGPRNVGKLSASSVPDIDPQQVEGELHKLLDEKSSPDVAAYKLIRDELGSESRPASSTRRKRETTRQLPLDNLINSGQNVQLNEETKRKMANQRPASNNPNYVQPELTSFGLMTSMAEELNWFLIDAGSQAAEQLGSVDTLIKQSLDMPANQVDLASQAEEGDHLTIDHRKTNCFHLPRDQGLCGSCYAFTAISLFEWLHCMKSGTLVAFSEQYLVDCGHTVRNSGCDGGLMYAVGKFVHNYGLELRVNYPYRARQDQCPYPDDTDPKQMGYLRMELTDAIVVPLALFEEYLQVGPIMISVSTEGDFVEYAGGVHEAQGCDPAKGDHAMLLIGQGRQDGKDYWLIRNSHSVAWGEGGYYKLWKRSKCIVPDHGVMYGTRDGLNFDFQLKENQANDGDQIRRHYLKKLSAK